MKREAARRLLAAAVLLLTLSSSAGAQEPEAPDVPSGPATLRGQVRQAETGQPVADAPVVLYALSQQGVPGLRRAVTDADGRFVFEGISNAPDVAYLVGARFQDVPYPGERVVFAGAEERRVEIRVAPVTREVGGVRVVDRQLRLDPSGGRLGVSETLVVENPGRATVYVPEAAREGEHPPVRVALPETLTDFRMPLGVVPEGVVQEPGRLAFWGPIYPGRQELSWFYALAAEPPEEAAAEGTARSDRFVWRAAVGEQAAPLHVEVPEGATRFEAPGAAVETLPTQDEDDAGEAAAVRRLAVRPPASGPLALVLRTPPARVAPEAVGPVEVRLVLHADAAAVEVTETHMLRVEGGERVRSGPERPLHRIVLPERLADLRFGSDAPDVTLEPDAEGGLAVEGSLPPGESRVEVAYRLPVEAFPTRVERRFTERLPLLSVFLAETGGLVPHSERLHRRRPVRTQDLTYAHFEAFEVEPGETVALEIGHEAPRMRVPRAAWLGAGGVLAVAAIAFLLAPVWEARSRGGLPPSDEPDADERERQALYDAIRDLDHDFETGKVSEEDHARLRADLRAQAVAALARAREAKRDLPVPRATGGEPTAAACGACGALPRSGDRFCARCGAPLEAAGKAASDGSAAS
jgi:hypothetical protein